MRVLAKAFCLEFAEAAMEVMYCSTLCLKRENSSALDMMKHRIILYSGGQVSVDTF